MQYFHKVKRDESLKDICLKYSVFGKDILGGNNIAEENIKEGLLLVIDVPEGVRYVVKPFDNISKIAEKFRVSESEIMEFNRINQVFLGQVIYIPI